MRSWALTATAVLLTGAFVAALTVTGFSPEAKNIISNDGQLLAALLACTGCVTAARRSRAHRRTAWWWQAVGTGSWAVGQAIWSYYEIILRDEVPFPSYADIGFLLFPTASAIGIVLWLGSQQDQLVARGRDLLDGLIIAVSLLAISWVTSLGSVVQAGGQSLGPLLIALAYPVGDLMLATLVLMALTRERGRARATMLLLAAGLGGLAVSDSAYVYLTSTSTYSSVDLVTAGWVAGFLFVAAAGLGVPPESTGGVLRRQAGAQRVEASTLSVWLPYVPVIAAGIALCIDMLKSPTTPPVDVLLAVVLIVLVLTRQFLAILDNQRLLRALAEARDQLQHQALHDALTGVANRVLFEDRLDRALTAPDPHVSVLFCDIDDFKTINDLLGHAAGDEVLAVIARRLVSCVRDSDTVARLGGDEFAMLLAGAEDPMAVAERVVATMQQPVEMGGQRVVASVSVGLASHRSADHDERPPERLAAPERTAIATRLLRHADDAMYTAKRHGKGRVVPSSEDEAVA